MKKITNRAELEAALNRRQDICNLAVTEKRDWTPAEAAEIAAINHEADRYQRLSVNGNGSSELVAGDPLVMGRAATSPASALGLRDHRPLTFRDISTGDIVRAVGSNDRVANNDDLKISFYDYLHGAMGNRDSQERVNAAMQTNMFASGGALVPTGAMARQFIDLARARSALISAGTQTVAMQTPDMKIVTITGDPTPSWRGELQDIPASDPTFAALNVIPKACGAMVWMSREEAEDAPNAGEIAGNLLMASMGQSLDLFCLRGPASGAGPTGLRYKPINVIDYTSLVSPAVYTHTSKAQRKIYEANYDGDASGLSWIMPPARQDLYSSASDTTGQPLRQPGSVDAMQKVISNQIPTNLVGATTEEYFGRFDQSIIFVRTGIEIQVSLEASIIDKDGTTVQNMFSKNAVAIRAVMRADFIVLRPTWFTVVHKLPT